MRDYGRVYTAFWTSEEIRSLSDDGRLLALYLLTSPHTTIAGVFRIPDGYVSDDLQWPSERVSNGFDELIRIGFACRCEATKWVWIRKFLEWNAPEGPNQWKAARKVAALVPASCAWKAAFSRVFAVSAGDPEPSEDEPIAMGSETPYQAHSNSGSGSGAGSGSVSAAAPPTRKAVSRGSPAEPEPWFLDFKLAYPDRAGDQNWRGTLRAARARIAEGHTPEEFLAGAKRYAEFCAAMGKVGTEYVKQAATFLGPSKAFLEPWKAPHGSGAPRREGLLPDAFEVAGRAS